MVNLKTPMLNGRYGPETDTQDWLVSLFINLHDFRYEGGAPINSESQIPLVNERRKYSPSYHKENINLESAEPRKNGR